MGESVEPITPLEAPAAAWAHALGFAGTGRGKNVRRNYAATLVPVMALYVAWMFPHFYRLDRATYVQIRARQGGQRLRHLILLCAPLLLAWTHLMGTFAAALLIIFPLHIVMRRKPSGAKVPDADWKIGPLVRTGPGAGGLFATVHLLRSLAAAGQTIGILAAPPAPRDIYVKRYGFISVTPGSLELIVTIT